MKLNDLAKVLFLLIILHSKVQKDPEMKKEPCFATPRGVWALSLNPYPPNDASWRFSGLIRFEPLIGHLLFLLEKKTKSIRFCTKFYVKVAINWLPKYSSLMLHSKPVQRNQRQFLKSFRK